MLQETQTPSTITMMAITILIALSSCPEHQMPTALCTIRPRRRSLIIIFIMASCCSNIESKTYHRWALKANSLIEVMSATEL